MKGKENFLDVRRRCCYSRSMIFFYRLQIINFFFSVFWTSFHFWCNFLALGSLSLEDMSASWFPFYFYFFLSSLPYDLCGQYWLVCRPTTEFPCKRSTRNDFLRGVFRKNSFLKFTPRSFIEFSFFTKILFLKTVNSHWKTYFYAQHFVWAMSIRQNARKLILNAIGNSFSLIRIRNSQRKDWNKKII